MKLFYELTPDQQEKAVTFFTNKIAFLVGAGSIKFDDNLDNGNLQTLINKIREESERLQTPWFIIEMLLKDKHIAKQFKAMAECDAREAVYLEEDEEFVQLKDLK